MPKHIHIIINFNFILGWILMAFASNPIILYLGRFVQGLSDALCVTPSLLFASEIRQASYRGTLINSASLLANVGVPVAYIVAGFLSW